MSDTPSNPTTPAGMPCPRCRVDLVMSDRQGIEIDYCPKCRGVWLDRGELDKIIERNAQYLATPPQEAPPASAPAQSPWVAPSAPLPGYAPAAPPHDWGQGYGQDDGHGGHGGGHHGRGHGRRNSFLGRLFD